MAVTNYHTIDGEIIGETTEGSPRVDYLTDALGSVTATVNQSGSVVNTYRYTPFGSTLAKTGTGADPAFGWVGEQGYRPTGNKFSDFYVMFRHYDELNGRWPTQDQIGFYGSDLSSYRYAGNRPTLWTDPSGLVSCDWCRQLKDIVGEEQTALCLKICDGGKQTGCSVNQPGSGIGKAIGGGIAIGGGLIAICVAFPWLCAAQTIPGVGIGIVGVGTTIIVGGGADGGGGRKRIKKKRSKRPVEQPKPSEPEPTEPEQGRGNQGPEYCYFDGTYNCHYGERFGPIEKSRMGSYCVYSSCTIVDCASEPGCKCPKNYGTRRRNVPIFGDCPPLYNVPLSGRTVV